MASRILVAAALIALCHSSPAFNDVRAKRYTKIVQANSQGYGGSIKSSASSDEKTAQGFGSYDDHGNLGQALPGKTEVRIEETGTPYTEARYQPAYYPAAPPSVVTYSQNFDDFAQPAPSGIAQSSATAGAGGAVSNAQAHINEPNNIASRIQGYNAYNPGYGSASSNANAASSARFSGVPARKSISWRFGTAYDQPAAYVRSAPIGSANTNVRTVGDAQSLANADLGSVSAYTKSNGGRADSDASVNNPSYYVLRSGENNAPGNIHVEANSIGHGTAGSNADNTRVQSFANSRSDGSAKSAAYTRPNFDITPSFKAQELSANVNVNSRTNAWGSGAAANAYSG